MDSHFCHHVSELQIGSPSYLDPDPGIYQDSSEFIRLLITVGTRIRVHLCVRPHNVCQSESQIHIRFHIKKYGACKTTVINI